MEAPPMPPTMGQEPLLPPVPPGNYLTQPGMPLPIPVPNQSSQFLGGPTEEIQQENKCMKLLCPVCIYEDRWDTNYGINVLEQSNGVERIGIQWLAPCLSKTMNYNISVANSRQLYNINQERQCIWLEGWTQNIFQGPHKVGSVGLPNSKVWCKTDYGVSACCASWILCTGAGSPCTGRYAGRMTGASCVLGVYTCCCNDCKVLPVLGMDANDTVVYRSLADMCQWGLICGSLCCDPCRTITHDIVGPYDLGVQGQIISYHSPDWYCYWCQTGYKLSVRFPMAAGPTEKAILFAMALSLYHLYLDI